MSEKLEEFADEGKELSESVDDPEKKSNMIIKYDKRTGETYWTLNR